MYTPLWNAVLPHLSAERMQAEIAEFFELSRWSSFDKIESLAEQIVGRMEAAGLEDVRLIKHPADGKTAYGGWYMPRAYDVRDARLTALVEGEPEVVLADYRANPTSLMMYSLPTPPEGITAELVFADAREEFTPERLSGRFVLTSGIGVEVSEAAMAAGALGLVSDCHNGHRFFKNGPEVDATNEWHNYTIRPWDHPGKGFGFSISPEAGRRLRAQVAVGKTARLHAFVDTTHYDGVLPVVSGRLPGIEPDEIVLTGHYDEFGADDNCSQVAVMLEVVGALRAMLAAGEIPPLRRSVRLLLPMEVRGFNALIQDEAETRHLRAGLNIDTVGTDQNLVTATCTLSDSFAALPSFVDDLAAELLERVAEGNPLFRWRRTGADVIDNIFGEPLVGAPTPAIWHYSATHHLATDTPERVSGRMLVDMARVAATYAGYLAGAGLPEALWLAERVADRAVRRFQDVESAVLRGDLDATRLTALRNRLDGLHAQYRRKLGTPRWLVPSVEVMPAPEILAEQEASLLGPDRLLPRELFADRVMGLETRLDAAYDEIEARMLHRAKEFFGIEVPAAGAASSAPTQSRQRDLDESRPHTASRCVPVKAFRGFLAFEDLGAEDREYLRSELEIPFGYGAPGWLQSALMFANGKRTAGEISTLLERAGGGGPEAERLERVFAFLARQGRVRLRPYVTQADVRSALEGAGLAAGDIVLGHFSLSRFGYIDGGEEALIDTVLSLLGPEGTLLVPTFTWSWVGRRAYDPRTTPSRVGRVTDRFWRRPGVRRSAHPTHSFAGTGPHADALLEGHDHMQSPISPDGPIGRLADLGGKGLLFAPRGANTAMHVGEYRGGLPLPDFLCPVVEEGVRREVLVPACPWHARFAAAYEKVDARGLMREVALGESTLYTMRCADAIATQEEVVRETPGALIQPGCDCVCCRRLQEHCRERGGEKR